MNGCSEQRKEKNIWKGAKIRGGVNYINLKRWEDKKKLRKKCVKACLSGAKEKLGGKADLRKNI